MSESPPVERADEIPNAEAAIAAAIETIDGNLLLFSALFPDDTTLGGVYPLRRRPGMTDGANVGWTTSFWPGMLWLAHQATGQERYRRAAQRFVPSYERRLAEGVDLDTHDLGFLYTLGCVVAWRLAGDRDAREAALRAADHLMTRYLEPAGIIQAWGDLGKPEQRGQAIIDSLMNTPLLYWASAETADPRYARAARRHARQLRDRMLRDEGSTFHTFFWDPSDAALPSAVPPSRAMPTTHAGRAARPGRSTDSRSITGSQATPHCSTPRGARLTTSCATCPSDRIPHWDLALAGGADEPRDSSAAAIAAAGLIELAQLLESHADTEAADRYRAEAYAILASLVDDYATGGATGGRPLIDRGVYDAPKNIGVNEGNLWGDYFYLECLVRLTAPDWVSFW